MWMVALAILGLVMMGRYLLPVIDVRLQLGELLAADTTTLAPVVANEIALISVNFTPNEALTLADITLATFTGSSPKAGAGGAQQVGLNPSTGAQTITILAPAGGWRWECTATPGAPETIYGYALTDTGGTLLLGVKKLPVPVVISTIGNYVDLGAVEIALVTQPMS